MDELLTHDHSELDDLLAAIFAAFDANDAARIHRTIDFFWARLAMHIRAEHLHLFPALLGACASPKRPPENCVPSFEIAQNTIARLHDDHDFFMRQLVFAIKQMRDLRQNISTDSANRLLIVRETIDALNRRLKTHNEREETEVYQWAQTLLGQPVRAELNTKMQKEIENLPPRFGKSEPDGNL